MSGASVACVMSDHSPKQHSFSHPLNKGLLSIYPVLGTVLELRDQNQQNR